jgi:hypothetical protein
MICSVSVPPETGDRLTDADLRKSEVKLTSIMKPAAFVPAVPVTVLQAVVQARAEKALPLILAIHRQLQMSGRSGRPSMLPFGKRRVPPTASSGQLF